MPTEKVCPECGSLCQFEELEPHILFGYRCKNCGCEFNVFKIVVGWNNNEIDDRGIEEDRNRNGRT